MLFSSIPFLYYFLPAVLVIYFLAPKILKNSVLLLSGLAFYAWGEPRYVIIMTISIVLGYVFGLLIARAGGKAGGKRLAKIFLFISVCLSASFLIYFKYADFFISNFNAVTGLSVPLLRLALPIGISFYTFQIISYSVDVYRGEPVQKNIIDLAAYITMFPQLIAGPIVRYSDIARMLKERRHSFEMASHGIRRFIFGLGKKILIANQLGELCAVWKSTGENSLLFVWLYAVAYSLHIYFDFSGYSDMAIGLGKLFGFDFIENFNYPYISKSVTEFWRRWHISLGSWFRDYVYIPMGGNRVGKARQLFNILVVWMFTGFWHGASWNFIAWGLFFAVLLILEKNFLLKAIGGSRVISRIYVLISVIISFVIFDSADLASAGQVIASMFGFGDLPISSPESLYCLRSFAGVLLIALIGATPIPKMLVSRVHDTKWGGRVITVLEPVVLMALLLVMTGYLADGAFNPFLYFRF